MTTPPNSPAPTPTPPAAPGGMPKVVLVAPDDARAEVYLHGAHVASWKPAPGVEERLFLSERSAFRRGIAIRGGVPVIFPQFAGLGPYPKHGFARTSSWELVALGPVGREAAGASFRLASSPATRAIWPHDFVLELAVTVGGPSLELRLVVQNVGADRFAFTGALHTYLRVADVGRVTVHGMQGVRYRDSAAGGAERVEPDAAVAIAGEVDRIYLGAPPELEVREADRTTVVATTGFPDVVLWNPGPTRAATLADLEPGGWQRFLCVEAAVAGAPVQIEPGGRWVGTQRIEERERRDEG